MGKSVLIFCLSLFYCGTSCAAFAAGQAKDAKTDEFNDKPDDLGCYTDYVTGSYVCDDGPLSGREFLSKAEALDELKKLKKENEEYEDAVAPVPKDGAPVPPALNSSVAVASPEAPEHLRVLSWNMKSLEHEDPDYDRAALVMADADLVVLQEVDLNQRGSGFMNVIANLVQKKAKEKICRAWVQDPHSRRNFGFLWKDKSLGYVDPDGSMTENCGEVALTVHQEKSYRYGVRATFYLKSGKKMFDIAAVYSDRSPKRGDRELDKFFQSFKNSKWPVIVAGDLKARPSHSALAGARKLGLHAALSGHKEAWENFWYRLVSIQEAKNVDLYQRFADTQKDELKKEFEGIFPIYAEFDFSEKSADTAQLISKRTARRSPAGKLSKKSKIRHSSKD